MKKKSIILLSIFLVSSLLLCKFTFLNISFSLFIPFLILGIFPFFFKFKKSLKITYIILYSLFSSVTIAYLYLAITLSAGTCQLNIASCEYGSDKEFRIDALIKKDNYAVGSDWEPEDFLFGVYNNKKKQARVKNDCF